MRANAKLICLVYSLLPIAANAFFCPGNFNQIDFGYSPEQVVVQCGKPDKEETKEITPEGPQEWNYYIPQTVSTTGSSAQQGTLKTQLTFDAGGKAINISVNGIGVGSTTICGVPIQLGDSRDQIKQACGDPTLVNKQVNPDDALKSQKVVIFTYMTNPPATLTFEGGRLTKKE